MPDTQISEEMVERGARAIAPLAWAALGTGDTLAQANRRKASLRHARAALEAALSGYVVVPREPTSRMICAALDDGDKRGHSQTCGDVYRAMIQAAPPVPEMEG